MIEITEIELMKLRDIAFEYLPVVRDSMQAKDKILRMRKKDYYTMLFSRVTLQCSISMTANELAAMRLLQALASYACYDINDPEQRCAGATPEEMYASTISGIAKSVEILSKVTGQTIKFDDGSIETENGEVIESIAESQVEIMESKQTTNEKSKVTPVFAEFENLRANEISLLMLSNGKAKVVIKGKTIQATSDDFRLKADSNGWKLLERACINNGDFSSALKSQNRKSDLDKEKSRVRKMIHDLNKKLKNSLGLDVNPISYSKKYSYTSSIRLLHEDIHGTNVTKGTDAMDYLSEDYDTYEN